MKPGVMLAVAVLVVSALSVTLVSCEDLSDATTTSSSTTITALPSTTTTPGGGNGSSSGGAVGSVSVPYVGFPNNEAEARSALAAVGLVASSSYVSSTGSMDFGMVVGQDPEAGTTVPVGSTVVITVHGTGQKAEVPDMIGMTESEAADALFPKYLHYQADHVPGPPADSGKVIDQDPPHGTMVDEGTSVRLEIVD